MAFFIWSGLILFVSGIVFVLGSIFKISELTGTGHAKDRVSREIRSIKKEFISAKERLKLTQEKLKDEEKSFNTLSSFLQKKDSEIGELKIALVELDHNFSTSVKEKDSLEDMVGALRCELIKAEEQARSNEELTKTPLLKEIDLLKNERQSLTNQRKGIENHLSFSQQEVVSLKKDILDSKERLLSTENAFKEARRAFAELSSYAHNKDTLIEDLTRKVNAAIGETEAEKREVVKVEAELNAVKAAMSELADEIKEKESFTHGLIRNMNYGKDKLENVSEENDVLKKKVETLEANIGQEKAFVSGKVDAAVSKVTKELKLAGDENVCFAGRIEELEAEIKSAIIESNSTKQSLGSVESNLTAAKHAIDEEKAFSGDLMESIRKKDELVDDVTKRMEGLTSELLKSVEDKASLKDKIFDFEREVITERGLVSAKVDKAKMVLQKVVDTLKDERGGMLERKTALERDLEIAANESETLRKELNHMNESAAVLRRGIDEKEAALKEMSDSIIEKDAGIDGLRSEFEALEIELYRVRKESEAEQQKMSIAASGNDVEIVRMRKKIEKLNSELAESLDEKALAVEREDIFKKEIKNFPDEEPGNMIQGDISFEKEMVSMRQEHAGILDKKNELDRKLMLSQHEVVLLRNTVKDVESDKSRLKKLLEDYGKTEETIEEMAKKKIKKGAKK